MSNVKIKLPTRTAVTEYTAGGWKGTATHSPSAVFGCGNAKWRSQFVTLCHLLHGCLAAWLPSCALHALAATNCCCRKCAAIFFFFLFGKGTVFLQLPWCEKNLWPFCRGFFALFCGSASWANVQHSFSHLFMQQIHICIAGIKRKSDCLFIAWKCLRHVLALEVLRLPCSGGYIL